MIEVEGMVMADQNWTDHDSGWYPLQDQFASVPYHSHVVIGSFMVVILFLAVGGNAVAVAIFMGTRKLRTPSNTLVLNLAVADLLMAVCGFPLLIVSSFNGGWAFEPWVCDFYGTTATAFGLMSINTLVFISLDRYVVIVGSQHIPSVTSKNVRFCILAIWVYSFLWGIIPMFGWNRYILEGYGTTCSIDYFTREEPHNQFLLFMLLGDYAIPCGLIVCFYILIFRTVQKHGTSFQPMMSKKEPGIKRGSSMQTSIRVYTSAADQQTKKEKRRFKWTLTEYKIARTVLLVVLLYCMAWTPYAVITLIGQYGDVNTITPTVSMLPAVFAKISTVYNPFVYALTHPRFKLQLKKILMTIFPASMIARTPPSRETSTRVSGRLLRRTCETSDSNSASEMSVKEGAAQHALTYMDSSTVTTGRQSGSLTNPTTTTTTTTRNSLDTAQVSVEVASFINDEGGDETLTPIQEDPEQFSEEERYLMKVAMTQDRKELSQAKFLPRLGQRDSDLFKESFNHSSWRDISGESLRSVNVEAIRLETIN